MNSELRPIYFHLSEDKMKGEDDEQELQADYTCVHVSVCTFGYCMCVEAQCSVLWTDVKKMREERSVLSLAK